MDAPIVFAVVAALSVAFLFRHRLSKAGDVFHDEPAVLSKDDAMAAGLDIVWHLKPKGYLSEAELLANLDAIQAAADAPLPLACRRLRRARDTWLARYRNDTLRELREVRRRGAQKARLAAHGL